MCSSVFKLSFLVLAGIMLITCASTPKEDPFETEKLLVAGGFQYKIADTPELQSRLNNLPQHQLIPYQHEGRVIYLYADQENCNCVFIGEEENYQKYLEIARSRATVNRFYPEASGVRTYNTDVGSFMDRVDSGTHIKGR